MEQLSLLEFEAFNKPISTFFKKSEGRKSLSLEEIEKALRGDVGTLHLHLLKKIKAFDHSKDYYEYFLKHVYNTFLKDEVSKIGEDEESIRKIEEFLSDENVTVKLIREPGREKNLVKSNFAFYVELSSKDRRVVYLTAKDFVSKSKHKSYYYFKDDKHSTLRQLADVRLLLADVFLQKEMRYFYLCHKDCFIEVIESIMIDGDDVLVSTAVSEDVENKIANDFKGRRILKRDFRFVTAANLAYAGKVSMKDLSLLYEECEHPYKNLPTGIYYQLLRMFMDRVVPKVEDVVRHVSMLRNSSGEYARTYELKKNIPKKTQELMDSSGLKNVFETVEYDELVDLNAAKKFETEIIRYLELFGLSVPDGAHFKIRRLGKHRAKGLFFPLVNVLAIDVNHPDAFIHEFWHMIDYYHMHNRDGFSGRRLSSEPNFASIVETYREVVSKDMESQPSEVKEQFFGSSKYNKDYYFENTEIFARTAEIYFAKHLNLSSLVSDKESVFYPDDENLNMLIDAYFEDLMEEKNNVETRTA